MPPRRATGPAPPATADSAALRRALLAWYRRHARDLPWRRTRDPYRIWLAEVLAQQTRVETAIPYYERFLAALPTVADLAAAPLGRVLALWAGCGYYARARHLHQAARTIMTRHGGRLPTTAAAWRTLPGVGRYTAGAIASIAFGERVAVLDGNVKRVLARLLKVSQPIDAAPTVAQLWAVAEALVPVRSPGDYNQALMELGARICTPRKPACDACPIARWCRARAAGVQGDLPRRRRRSPVPEVHAVAAAITRSAAVLLCRRPPDGLLGGLWTLPGTHIGPNAFAPHASTRCLPRDRPRLLRLHLAAHFGLAVVPGALLGSVRHDFSHRRLWLHVYAATIRSRRRPPSGQHEARCAWVPRARLESLPCAALDRRAIALLGPPAEAPPASCPPGASAAQTAGSGPTAAGTAG